MKYFLAFLLLLSPVSVFAESIPFGTADYSEGAGSYGYARHFIPSSDASSEVLHLGLYNNSASGSIHLYITEGSLPDVSSPLDSVAYNLSGLTYDTSCATQYDFHFSAPLVAGHDYWVVEYNTGSTGDYDICEFSASTDTGVYMYDDLDNSWISYDGYDMAGSIDLSNGNVLASATTTEALLGNVNMGLAIIITLAFIGFIGYVYNLMTKKKPWR